ALLAAAMVRFRLSEGSIPPAILGLYWRWWSRNLGTALSGGIDSRRRDLDQVCGPSSDADHGSGRLGDAEGRSRRACRRTAAMLPIASGVVSESAAGPVTWPPSWRVSPCSAPDLAPAPG